MCNSFVSRECVHAIEPWETSWTEETSYIRHKLAQTREARRGWLGRIESNKSIGYIKKTIMLHP